MTHPSTHFFVALGLIVATVASMAALSNPVIKRRLLFSLLLLLAVAGVHVAVTQTPSLQVESLARHALSLEELLLSLALINFVVTLAFNPWFKDRASDRAPAIVQDTLVLGLFVAVATFLFRDRAAALTGSAIAAAVVGFALQETLGNAFAGLAIQIDKPFRVGHWITLASFEGIVVGVTWRATKIRTKAGNLVIIPNNVNAREAITNFSEPVAPTRLYVEVGAAYGVPPNEVRAAMMAAMRQVPRVLAQPRPDVLLQDFGSSAIVYRARFWIDDFALDDPARDEVRTAIAYEFRRRNIEIPWPIQVEYRRNETTPELSSLQARFTKMIASVPALAPLSPEAHRALAESAAERLFGDREVIVREGEPGSSMFVVGTGRVAITIGKENKEVAVTEAGGYFGEMSLLTGEPRTATVTARGDCQVLEIGAEAFGAYVRSHPGVIDQIAAAAAKRRKELDESRATATRAAVHEPGALAVMMRKFFGLS